MKDCVAALDSEPRKRNKQKSIRSGMAVRSRKYSRLLFHVRGNICAVRGNIVIPKYILFVPRNIYISAQNVLTCAEILSVAAEIYLPCAETYSQCAETYSLCAEIEVLCGNLFTVRGNLCAARKYFQVPLIFFVCARKLSCPMRGFWASNHFRNAVVP